MSLLLVLGMGWFQVLMKAMEWWLTWAVGLNLEVELVFELNLAGVQCLLVWRLALGWLEPVLVLL